MITIHSKRALSLLEQPRFIQSSMLEGMVKYPGGDFWGFIELDQGIVKKLSFSGKLEDHKKVFVESMASLLINKPITKIDDLSIRECEAFLRDKNSEPAISGMTESDESELRKIFQWVRFMPLPRVAKNYDFPSEKGPFERLKLVDKIREIKAFLNSPEILTLYQGLPLPELVDVEDLTVYIHAPYDSQKEKSLFEKLHHLGVAVFREENLNFIPDA